MRRGQVLPRLVSVAAAVSLTVAGLAATTAPVQAASPDPGNGAFFVAYTPEMTFADAVELARTNPVNDPAVVDAAVASLREREAAGEKVVVPHLGADTSLRVADLAATTPATSFREPLTSLPHTPAPGGGGKGGPAETTSGISATSTVSTVDPRPWPFSGYGYPTTQARYYAWYDLRLEVAGRYCSPFACGSPTDVIKMKISTDPGAKTSKVSRVSIVYSPNSGRFSDVRSTNYVACQGGTGSCGVSSANGLKPGTSYVSSSTSMNGRDIMHGFSLNAAYSGGRIIDKRRTGTATCNRSDNQCYYY